MSIRIALANHKGGTGKTTLCGNLAYGLAALGLSVLAVDMDPQANLTMLLGCNPYPGVYDFLVRDEALTGIMRSVSPLSYGANGTASNLAVLGSNIETQAIDHFVRDSMYFRERLEEYDQHFDYVLIDTPPTHARKHALVFRACDWVIIPTECDAYSLKGMQEIINVIGKMRGTEIAGVIPNRIRPVREDREVEAELRKRLTSLVWDSIDLSVVWKEAGNRRKPVFMYQPDHRAAVQVRDLIARVHQLGVTNG